MAGHKFDPKKAKHLTGGLRQRFIPASTILGALQPKETETWAEVGAGTGYFTVPLAALAAKVFALDVSQEMLTLLEVNLDDARLDNIEVIKSREDELPLADESVDAVLMAFVAHELDHPAEYFMATARTMRPGGRLCIVEFGGLGTWGPPKSHRVNLPMVQGWAEAAGLSLSATWEWSRSLLFWKIVDLVGWQFQKSGGAGD